MKESHRGLQVDVFYRNYYVTPTKQRDQYIILREQC